MDFKLAELRKRRGITQRNWQKLYWCHHRQLASGKMV